MSNVCVWQAHITMSHEIDAVQAMSKPEAAIQGSAMSIAFSYELINELIS